MPLYAVAARRSGNMLVQAFSREEASRIALAGGGVWESSADDTPEIELPIDIFPLESENTE